MSKQPCFGDAEDRLKEISAKGDPLETLAEAVEAETGAIPSPRRRNPAGKWPGSRRI